MPKSDLSGDPVPETVEVPATPTTPSPSDDPVLALLDRISGVAAEQTASGVREQAHCVTVSVAELKSAIARNPGHEIAVVYTGAIRNMKDHEEVHVEQPDLQALIQNRQVRIDMRRIGNEMVRTKTIV